MKVPLWASFLTAASPGPELTLKLELVGHDDLGRFREWWTGERRIPFAPWMSRALEPVAVPMPARRAVAVLRSRLEDAAGQRPAPQLHHLRRGGGRLPPRRDGRRRRAAPARPAGRHRRGTSAAQWSVRAWDAMDGHKQNGAGAGFFEYRLAWPKDLRAEDVAGASFLAELGAKQLFGKDRVDAGAVEGDFMRGKGTHDPGRNPNAYPMTDAARYPSAVRVVVNGVPAGVFDLPRRPRRPPRRPLLARPEAGREAAARPAPTASSSPRASPRRPCARPRRRARS